MTAATDEIRINLHGGPANGQVVITPASFGLYFYYPIIQRLASFTTTGQNTRAVYERAAQPWPWRDKHGRVCWSYAFIREEDTMPELPEGRP